MNLNNLNGNVHGSLLGVFFLDAQSGSVSVLPDRTSPTLSGYSLDMELGVLELTFDETINSASFDVKTAVLQRSSETLISDAQRVQLTGSRDIQYNQVPHTQVTSAARDARQQQPPCFAAPC